MTKDDVTRVNWFANQHGIPVEVVDNGTKYYELRYTDVLGQNYSITLFAETETTCVSTPSKPVISEAIKHWLLTLPKKQD